MRRDLVAAAVAVSVFFVAACGGGAADNGGAPVASASTDPFRAFASLQEHTEEQSKAIYEARESAVADCMKSRGFTYKPVPYQSADETGWTWGNIDYARKHGYGFNFAGVDGGAEGEAGPAAEPDQTAGMSDAERAAWTKALLGSSNNPDAQGKDPDLVEVKQGDSTTSFSKSACRTYAAEQVEGDSVEWLTTEARFTDVAQDVEARTNSDPRFAEVKKKWAECMTGRGYQFTDPEQAQVYVGDRVRAKQITESEGRRQEAEVAVADAECANSVKALETRREIMAENEKAARQDHENEILAFQELQAKAVERATSLAQSR